MSNYIVRQPDGLRFAATCDRRETKLPRRHVCLTDEENTGIADINPGSIISPHLAGPLPVSNS